jgi:hypothetical protein
MIFFFLKKIIKKEKEKRTSLRKCTLHPRGGNKNVGKPRVYRTKHLKASENGSQEEGDIQSNYDSQY